MDETTKFFLKPWVAPVAAGVGFILGGVTGYFIQQHRNRMTDVEILEAKAQLAKYEEETVELEFKTAELNREFNHQIQQAAHVTRELKEQGETLLGALQTLNEKGGGTPVPVIVDERKKSFTRHPANGPGERRKLDPTPEYDEEGTTQGPNVVNIFDSAGDEWDYKTELEARTPDAPYIIHVDEYVADENDWDSHSTLTYYADDDILTDSHDTPIYNYRDMVGELRFGHGSLDPNVVHVRNEHLKAEYEIIRDPGSYEITALTEQEELKQKRRDLKHSHLRKFRDD